MNATWLVNNIIAAFLLPPVNLLLLATAGLLLRDRFPRAATWLSVTALLALLILSTGAGARMLITPLEALTPPLISGNASGAQAIVILGGGRIKRAPEYEHLDMPSLITMARLRYGAKLHRDTKLPLLVTGGKPDGAGQAEAVLMARVLREELGTPVRWLEQESNNTAENARFSIQTLKQEGIQRILLVTDALHMPRAHAIFAKQGIEVVAAPTIFLSAAPVSAEDFIPQARQWANASYALHEWIGLAWYWLRHDSLPTASQRIQAAPA